MLKLKMMLCVMMLPLVVVGCTSKQSVSQCVKPPPPPAWIMQPPPTGRHRWTGLFHPQRGWSLCKNNWKEPRSILINVQIELPYRWKNSCNYCEQYAFQQAWKMPKVNKTEQSIYECLLGFCFNNVCAATNFGCIDSSSAQIRNEEMMGDGFLWCYCCGLFWTVNVCWAHPPVISRASAVASSIFALVLFPMLLKFAESYVWKLNKTSMTVEISYC